MAELEAIAETLRRQRQELDDTMDSTLSRVQETSRLLEQVSDLRRRAEQTQRRYARAVADGETKTASE